MKLREGFVIPIGKPKNDKYWGHVPLPGTGKGHIAEEEQQYILQRTGWKVSSRPRNAGPKGKQWGGRLLSGCTNFTPECLPYSDLAKRLAEAILLYQQETGDFPCAGATVVRPRMMQVQKMPPWKQKRLNPPTDLKSTAQAGYYQFVPANINLYTIGFDSGEAFYDSNDDAVKYGCQQVLKDKLSCSIPMDRIFDCSHLNGYAAKRQFENCTGSNYEIFQMVWHQPGIRALVQKVLRSYDQHNKTRNAGENYSAAFFCKSGNHRSVAVATGLKTLLMKRSDMQVSVRHLNQEDGGWDRFCGGTCRFCCDWPGRKAWEDEVVQSAM